MAPWEWYRNERRFGSSYENFDFRKEPNKTFDNFEIRQSIRLSGHHPRYWKYHQIGKHGWWDALQQLTKEEIEECEELTGKHPKYWFYSMGGGRSSSYTPEQQAECLEYTGFSVQQLDEQKAYDESFLYQRRSGQIGLGLGALSLFSLAYFSPPGSIGTSLVFGGYFLNSLAISILPEIISFNVAKGGVQEGGVFKTFFPFHLGLNWYLLYQTMRITYGDGPQQPLRLFVNQLGNTTMWQVNGVSILVMIIIGQSIRGK